MKQEAYIQGKWYWFEFKDEYPCIARVNNTTVSCSEFALQVSEFYTKNGMGGIKEHTFFEKDCKGLATTDQIEACLKAYAEKNGYVGAKVKMIKGDVGNTSESIQYLLVQHGIVYGVNHVRKYTIYENGKWAEIVAHAPSVQDKQDEALTESIREFVKNKDIIVSCPTDESGNYDLSGLYVCLDDKEVTLKELCETYYKMLEIKTIIG